ncbi:alkaline-phosphatase-like protein [Achaetomium macrosporum]|uniref:Alkaline-phosphatase-like protein n=1 Tax=Achaetomium macrosporum TaxID=79813 RepID=A0AAN7C4Y9_9PEZI|nr:alkaline-phosphatase-like protein [Achaetomium macrosporum]
MKGVDELGLWKDTPLIIGGAGLPEGQVITSMTEMVDLVPTMLEVSGIGEKFAHNGLSWVPLLLHGDSSGHPHEQYAFSEGGFLESEEPLLEQTPYPYDLKAGFQHQDTKLMGKAISLRDSIWTYVHHLYEPPELHYQQNDPRELHNLAADLAHAHLVAKYEQAVLQWLLKSADVLPWSRDPRLPEVKLKGTRDQMEERLEAQLNWPLEIKAIQKRPNGPLRRRSVS